MTVAGQVALITGGGRGIGRAFALALAAGKADALSGRSISVEDDLDDLVARADEIRQRDLLMLRPRLL